jgi:hypothetical protein
LNGTGSQRNTISNRHYSFASLPANQLHRRPLDRSSQTLDLTEKQTSSF